MQAPPDTFYEHHDRTEFQLERVMLFTDAVFAIAITLLVIEIKVPELHHLTERAAVDGLLNLTPKFIGFLVSFFIIAVYWTAHHRIFRFVRRLDNGLIWLNLLFLLSIVLMPFTTAYQSEYVMLRTPWILYSLNVIGTGLLQTRLQAYLRRPAAGLTEPAERLHPDLDLVRPLLPPAVFVLSIGLSFVVHPSLMRMIPGIIFPLIGGYFRSRYRRLEAAYTARLNASAAPTAEASAAALVPAAPTASAPGVASAAPAASPTAPA